jgi:hypothetical protein
VFSRWIRDDGPCRELSCHGLCPEGALRGSGRCAPGPRSGLRPPGLCRVAGLWQDHRRIQIEPLERTGRDARSHRQLVTKTLWPSNFRPCLNGPLQTLNLDPPMIFCVGSVTARETRCAPARTSPLSRNRLSQCRTRAIKPARGGLSQVALGASGASAGRPALPGHDREADETQQRAGERRPQPDRWEHIEHVSPHE